MYATLNNHLAHFPQYLIATAVLFIVLPSFIFTKSDGNFLDRAVANYLRMVFVIIVLGYILVLLRLYEVLVLAPFLAAMVLYRLYHNRAYAGWGELGFSLEVLLYDIIDGRIHPLRNMAGWLKGKTIGSSGAAFSFFRGAATLGNMLLFLVVFGYAAYLRFYDAFANAAPAMSDAYVTLAWMKYISGKILFHDGIYPQGFHIFLATVRKFAAIDALYVLKYTGPLNSLLICLSIYYVVSRLSQRSAPGIIAASIYGLLGSVLLQGDWMRHASTNSQEFALLFILPTQYYFYLFLKNARMRDLWIGFSGVCVTGLVHSLAFAVVGLGMGVLALAALLVDFRKSLINVVKLCLAGIAAVVVSLAPLGVGLLMGKNFHGSSAEFLTSQIANPAFPQLNLPDYFALAALAILWLFSVFNRKPRREKLAEKYVVLLGLGIFILYYGGGVLTKSTVVAARSGEIWALFLPIAVGMGWYAFSETSGFLKRPLVGVLVGACLLGYILIIIKPEPILPYKMEHNSNVEQYLRITETFRPTEWLMASQEEGYSMVLGTSYHLMMQDFLTWYDPAEKVLVHRDNGNAEVLNSPDIFIYEEKEFLRAELDVESMKTLNVIYERKEQEKDKLRSWLQIYQSNHDNLSLFYEDEYLRVWRIHQPASKEEEFNKLWKR